jgi:hypothetical protein
MIKWETCQSKRKRENEAILKLSCPCLRIPIYKEKPIMKQVVFILCVMLLISFGSPIQAEEGNSPTRAENRLENIEARVSQKTEKKDELKTNAESRLKEKATKEIIRRIESLNKLVLKINAVKRLSSTQKADMVKQVNDEITSLTTLKTTIAGLTDIATIRTSVQSIMKSYRIYVLYMPKMTIIANADKILNLIEGEMTTLTTKLQMRIDEAKAKGNVVETMTTLMAQRQVKLTEATVAANGAITKVVGLTPDEWPGNKTELQGARTMLETARKAMNDGQKLANQVRTQLKGMGIPKTTVTPGVSVSPTEAPED